MALRQPGRRKLRNLDSELDNYVDRVRHYTDSIIVRQSARPSRLVGERSSVVSGS